MIILVFPDVAVELNLRRRKNQLSKSLKMQKELRFGNYGGAYVDDNIVSRKLPRIEVQPIIWYFYLITIHNFLLEDAITIPETIPPSRII